MDLPVNQSVFDFDFTSEIGKRYEGQFTVKCVLTMGEKHMLELEKTRLLGNFIAPTDELAGIAIALADLRHRVVKAPPWWEQSNGGYNISDFDAIYKLHNEVLKTESEWRKQLKEKAQKAKEPVVPVPPTTP